MSRAELKDLKPGDKITIMSRDSGEVRTVKRVMKFFLEDHKGEKWSISFGRSYGRVKGSWYRGPHAEAWIPDDDKEIAEKEAEARKHRMKWEIKDADLSKLSEADLNTICGIIHNGSKSSEASA